MTTTFNFVAPAMVAAILIALTSIAPLATARSFFDRYPPVLPEGLSRPKLDLPSHDFGNASDRVLFERGFPTNYYYSISQTMSAEVYTILVLSSYEGSSIDDAVGVSSLPLGLCYAYPEYMFKYSYNAASSALYYTFYSDIQCSTTITTTSVIVSDYSVSSFVWTHSQYKWVSSTSYTSTSTPSTDNDIKFIYPFTYGLNSVAGAALAEFPMTQLPPSSGIPLVAPELQFIALQNQNLCINRLKYNIWAADQRYVPNGCEQIGNYYFTDILVTPATPNGIVTASEYACLNNACAYTVSSQCVLQDVIKINTVGTALTQMNAGSFFYTTFTALGTTVELLKAEAGITNYFINDTSQTLFGRDGSITNYAGYRTDYFFYPTTTVETAKFAVVTPLASCAGNPDYYFELDVCRFNDGEYAKRVMKDDGIYDEFYGKHFYQCGAKPLSSSRVSLTSEDCYSSYTKKVTRTVQTFSSAAATASPILTAIKPTATATATDMLAYMHSIPTEVAAHARANSYAAKIHDLSAEQIENDDGSLAPAYRGASIEAVPLYSECTKESDDSYRMSLREGDHILQLVCPTSSCERSECSIVDAFSFITELPTKTVPSVGAAAQVYFDINTVTVSNIRYTDVLTDFFVDPSFVTSLTTVSAQ